MPDGNCSDSRCESSQYQGGYDVYGKRNGLGAEKWRKQEQKFVGTFVRDAFHGDGAYEWFTGRGRLVFEGHFYSNFKEGYGLVSLPDGSIFEGLFSNNRPHGPGVKTHLNGRQDVGFWCGNRIVRLSRSVDCIIPRLASSPAGKLKLLQFQVIMPFAEKDADVGAALLTKHGLDPNQSSRLYSDLIHDPRSMFFDRPRLDVKVAKSSSSTANSQIGVSSPGDGASSIRRPPSANPGGERPYAPREVGDHKAAVDLLELHATDAMLNGSSTVLADDATTYNPTKSGESEINVTDDTGTVSGVTQLLSWNRSELCMEMLKQIFRFRSAEGKLTFKISDLMAGARSKFRKTGETERLNLYFLKMCSIGPAYVIKDFLCTKNISEALMDARGNNSIMFAAATDQHDVIELLFNYGADVNCFNDENLTPLNLCLLRRIAEAESLGNWEMSFLPPDSSDPSVEGVVKTRAWRPVESTASLDRIFGDGMSAYDKESLEKIAEFSERDSVFSFDDSGDNNDSQDLSSFTVLTFKSNVGVSDNVSGRTAFEGVEGGGGTEKLSKGICPKSFKREEYLRSVAEPRERDNYFFQLNVDESRQEGQEESKSEASAAIEIVSTPIVRSEALNEPVQVEKHFSAFNNDRLVNIDRTIEQLLRRGADPNLGDAPKPSLHLAVHSGDVNLVRLLLTYGAAPDSQTLPQEGLLTPLHVLVLMKPRAERIAMCELLLNYGASPEEETAPNFSPNGEADFLLDPDQGRTPLQLLCTRRDAEDVDPKGFLSQMALLLVSVSAIGHFFRGHSYLTLAMISGNYALAEALLTSKRIDPNEVLGRDLGTALHVLVSAEFQKRTLFENSIRMCDLLLERGANPHLRFRAPRPLAGTCIDYGYREIERERNEEQPIDCVTIKPDLTRHYLETHLRVVVYLEKKTKPRDEKGKNKDAKKRLGIEGDEKKRRGSGSWKLDKGDGGSGIRKLRMNEEEKEENEVWDGRRNEKNQISAGTRGGGANETGNDTKIIEIKKHVEKVTARKVFGAKDAARRGSRKKMGRTGKRNEEKMKMITGKRNLSKDKRNMKWTDGGGNERLPERFRQSLLHMFGICGERLHLNNFLLPYVVLRNGDLYYRFEGRKTAGMEQYSLI